MYIFVDIDLLYYNYGYENIKMKFLLWFKLEDLYQCCKLNNECCVCSVLNGWHVFCFVSYHCISTVEWTEFYLWYKIFTRVLLGKIMCFFFFVSRWWFNIYIYLHIFFYHGKKETLQIYHQCKSQRVRLGIGRT